VRLGRVALTVVRTSVYDGITPGWGDFNVVRTTSYDARGNVVDVLETEEGDGSRIDYHWTTEFNGRDQVIGRMFELTVVSGGCCPGYFYRETTTTTEYDGRGNPIRQRLIREDSQPGTPDNIYDLSVDYDSKGNAILHAYVGLDQFESWTESSSYDAHRHLISRHAEHFVGGDLSWFQRDTIERGPHGLHGYDRHAFTPEGSVITYERCTTTATDRRGNAARQHIDGNGYFSIDVTITSYDRQRRPLMEEADRRQRLNSGEPYKDEVDVHITTTYEYSGPGHVLSGPPAASSFLGLFNRQPPFTSVEPHPVLEPGRVSRAPGGFMPSR
jgi:hypothetical protein